MENKQLQTNDTAWIRMEWGQYTQRRLKKQQQQKWKIKANCMKIQLNIFYYFCNGCLFFFVALNCNLICIIKLRTCVLKSVLTRSVLIHDTRNMQIFPTHTTPPIEKWSKLKWFRDIIILYLVNLQCIVCTNSARWWCCVALLRFGFKFRPQIVQCIFCRSKA